MAEFKVLPTKERKDSKGEYILRMSLGASKRLFGSSAPEMVVVSYRHPKLENIEITAMVSLRVDQIDHYEIPDDAIQLDQTVRQCLGLDYADYKNQSVDVHKLHGLGKTGRFFSRLVGRRLVCCRPAILQPLDLEKDLIRLDEDAMGPLGVVNGDAVVVSGVSKDSEGRYWLRSRRVTVVAALDRYVGFYNDKSRDRSMEHRYTNIQTLLEQPDLHKVFLDFEGRNDLFGDYENQLHRLPAGSAPGKSDLYLRTIQCAQPVVIHRAPIGALAHEIGNIGTIAATGIAFFAITLPWTLPNVAWLAFALVISLLFGLSVAVLKTRTLWRS